MANLTGYGQAAAMPTSETVGTSVASPTLGSRWVDKDGNEYIVVDCQQAFVAGEFVYISSANLATRLNDTLVSGRVGVIVAAVSASDTKAYAQIYGLYAGAVGSSAVATSLRIGPAVGSSDIGAVGAVPDSAEGAAVIHGAYAVTATDSATTSPASSFVSAGSSATIYIGFSVWLNYPVIYEGLSGAILDT
jgi:hypothetical protein